MKTKALILIVAVAIATLSFVSVKNVDKPVKKSPPETASKAPSGGFMSEDKI